MKKFIIFITIVMGLHQSVAQSTNSSFVLIGYLNNSCTASLTAPNIYLGDLTQVQTATTVLQVSCRVGTTYNITTTSANGWQLSNGRRYIPYTINYTGGFQINIRPTWSGNAGNNRQILAAFSQIGDGLVKNYQLQVTNNAASILMPTGTYTDTVNISITYQ